MVGPITGESGADGSLSAQGQYAFAAASFASGAVVGLQIFTSVDGKSWSFCSPASTYTPPSADGDPIRDPDLIYNDFLGAWLCCYTWNAFSGQTSFRIAKSYDLQKWTDYANVSLASVSGITNAWGPRWFVDGDGSTYITIATATALNTGPFKPQILKANDASCATWSAPSQMTGSSLPASMFDMSILKTGSTYKLTYRNLSSEGIYCSTSTSVGTGYNNATIYPVTWPGTMESACLIQLDPATLRLYADQFTRNGIFYSESVDGGTTWSAAVACNSPVALATLHPLKINTFVQRMTALTGFVTNIGQLFFNYNGLPSVGTWQGSGLVPVSTVYFNFNSPGTTQPNFGITSTADATITPAVFVFGNRDLYLARSFSNVWVKMNGGANTVLFTGAAADSTTTPVTSITTVGGIVTAKS